MTWVRQGIASNCPSCHAYWSVLQDLGAEWDAEGRPNDPARWGAVIGRALAAYMDHLVEHMPTTA
ncbi:hypothetical protein OG897_13415 [Streptomyces sp. NBC_00237]|uniref:hypothetical protein n=1 Tax=Streptomyces sp. NBC_00237 TaxID=2975687 RepID=UPI0022502FC2|nr:hypothetical protein [Streptomyces sp. NBC_00237]MCX5202442.1 hypothetical protein [Streptomyces sp. NBC_00237]